MAPPECDEKQEELFVPMKCFVLHATSSLGTAVVRRFAREGPALILTDIPSNQDSMAALAKEASMQGASRCMIFGGDIYSTYVEQGIIDGALSTFGDVDVLVIVPPEEDRSGARTARHSAVVRALLDALAPRMEAKGGGYILAVLREGRDGRLASDLEAVRQASERRGGNVHVVWSAFRCTRSLDAGSTAEKLLNPLKAAASVDGLDVDLEEALGFATAPQENKWEEDEDEEEGEGEGGGKPGAGGGAATAARRARGVLVRRRRGEELCLATSETPGAVTTISDALTLQPDTGHSYEHEPARDPAMLVQCLEPFNGETPPSALVGSFLTETTTFFVRNHLPVPPRPSFEDYRLRVEGMGMATTELSLHELQSSFRQVTVTATLQCAGNRRAEMAAHHLVEGSAAWNAGAIGTAAWTGVLLRDVLDRCSNLPLLGEEGGPIEDLCAQFVILQGGDVCNKGRQHYEAAIPLTKALDPRGDVVLAYLMNGEALGPDHGYPLRAVIPGVAGARWTKWLHSIIVSETDSQSPWALEDYRLLPQGVKSLVQAKPLWRTAPPVLHMPVTAAILVPEAGTVIQRGTLSIDVRGYAWSGGGQSVQRVDVSGDHGVTWVTADWLHRPERRQAEGRTWAWALWQAKVPVPHHAQHRGVVELCVKALDRSGNTQPERVDGIWNVRGLNNNAWHRRLVYLE